MLQILYFASIRESLDREREQLELPGSVANVGELIDYLAASDPGFKQLWSGNNKLLVAVNQTLVDHSHDLSENDEVAFFPPMTGG